MERIATAKARKEFADVIKRAGRDGKRLKITHYGKTLVGVIPAKDLELLEDCEGRRRAAADRTARKTTSRR
jgi:prevent-host-death family protein